MDADGAFTGEVEYRHRSDETDHEPVPQPAAEHFAADLDLACDFCNATDPVWSYRAPGIGSLAFDGDDQVVHEDDFGDDWAACRTCAHLIERGMRRRLLDRAVAAFGDPALRPGLQALHAAFFLQKRGKRRRLG
ncbi:hypothetical protein [Glycomyces tenuis]|uniref:hypothetical protein n=1 Tax=Glycomyces tenuis TaxID=58116 RepID=UPI0012DBD620|nr:hypothetical protein [Glycomyces tenuis]